MSLFQAFLWALVSSLKLGYLDSFPINLFRFNFESQIVTVMQSTD